MLRRTQTLVVCQILAALLFLSTSHAGDSFQFAADLNRATVAFPRANQSGTSAEISPGWIVKCRPVTRGHYSIGAPRTHEAAGMAGHDPHCSLPEHRTGGWELTADAFFARNKGKVRFSRGMAQGAYGLDDIDLNSDLGMHDRGVMASFMAMYRFRPKWSLRYSIMPMSMMGSGQAGKSFVFGNTQYSAGQSVMMEWEHLEQRFGLMYDALHTHSSRVSLSGDYVRIADRIKVMQMQMQMGMGSDVMDNDLNMAMVGVEFEKCLKTTRMRGTLSLECKAGVGFLDDAAEIEAETAVKYSIPLNSGRWGFVKGGYRFLTYKKKSSDAKMFDIVMEGGFLQAGLIF